MDVRREVQLLKIVEVEKGEWRYQYKNKINLKSIDFVLFDKKYFTPQFAIELDDFSHQLPKRVERDNFLNNLLAKTEIELIHITTSKSYDVNKITLEIDKHNRQKV